MKQKPSKLKEKQILPNKSDGIQYNIVVTKRISRDTVLKIIGGILFVVITELCLGLHMHIVMTQRYNKINENFVQKHNIENHVIGVSKTNPITNELSERILKKVGDNISLSRTKRHNYFYVGIGHDNKTECIHCNPEHPNNGKVVPGAPGLRGPAGAKGAKGDRGDVGFSGSRNSEEVEAPIDLDELAKRLGSSKGEPGEDGFPALPGFPGEKGEKGEPSNSPEMIGIKGFPGEPGPIGEAGPLGVGLRGPPGLPGFWGEKGKPGLPGPVGPPGLPGVGMGLPGSRIRALGVTGTDGGPEWKPGPLHAQTEERRTPEPPLFVDVVTSPKGTNEPYKNDRNDDTTKPIDFLRNYVG